ncbi:MAG: CelD/BcsL family acetyltransferase involved in cellulose biosynthesis [Planctomycetaceae bacterium]|jgi:CelD/BcsL family acetyltransferase involved in cellulose biosynthesis
MATLSTATPSPRKTAEMAQASGLRVVEIPFDGLTPEFALRWAQLESRSIEGNAFLSPHFVIPAVEHLEGAYEQKPLILAVESEDGSELLALGLFELSRNSRLLPLTHLKSWQCEHTLFDGLLVDRQRGTAALTTFFKWFSQQGRRWQGIAFTDRSADGELYEILDNAAAESGAKWFEDWSSERAAIRIGEVPEDCLQTLYSKNRRRRFKRSAKQLASFGEVKYSFAGKADTIKRDVQAFLELEAMGWKGDEGTALLSSPGHEEFCREMASRFAADQQLVIYQLSVDGAPVASALNMRSADDLFCFKIGWNPEFASGSPGILNELNFLQNCRENLSDIRLADSCAKPGSYVEDVWPWKRRLTTGVFTTTRTGTLAANAMLQLKRMKRLLKKA